MSLNILHVIEGISNNATGQIAVVKNLIKSQGNNHNIDLFTIDHIINNITLEGLRKLYVYEPIIKKWKYSIEAKKSLQSIISNYDIVHVHGIWYHVQYLACKLSYHNNIPFIISLHGMVSQWFFNDIIKSLKYTSYLKLVFNQHLLNASLIHTMSEKETNEFLNKYSLKNKIVEIPNGIKIKNNYRVVDYQYNNEIYLLFIGRLHPIKGLDLLVKAWKKIYYYYPKVHLKILGEFSDSNYRKVIFDIIENNPNKYRIKFHGPVFGEEKWTFLGKARGFVLPSRSEACSITLLEAASIPKQIIVTENAILKGMKDEESAIIVQSNVDSISCGIKKLLNQNKNEKISMENSLHSLMRKYYDINKISSCIESAYYSMTKSKQVKNK